MNSGYVFESAEEAKARFAGERDGYLYSRYGNPTVSTFEERLSLNENAESCFATSSGMAAVFNSLMCCLNSGDEGVSSWSLFGSCYHIFDQILLSNIDIEYQLVFLIFYQYNSSAYIHSHHKGNNYIY